MANAASYNADKTNSGQITFTTQVLRVVVLGLLVVGCFLVLQPFLSALMWAAILCLSSWPVYTRLLTVLRGRRTLAALLMSLGTVLILLAPFVGIGASLADDVRNFTVAAQRYFDAPPSDPPAWVGRLPLVGSRAADAWRNVASNSASLTVHLRRLVEPATTLLLKASVLFVSGLAELALSIFLAFFLFRDGPIAVQRLVDSAEQLAGNRAKPLLDVAGRTVRSVVYGILGTALAQSIFAGIGFLIAGIPGKGLLTLLTFFAAITPAGAALVWIPVAIWLFSTGSIGWGIFMVVWGVMVSATDNVLKPLLISHGSNISFLLILLGVLGGAMAFGFIGIFLGPTLLAVGMRLLEQWNSRETGPA